MNDLYYLMALKFLNESLNSLECTTFVFTRYRNERWILNVIFHCNIFETEWYRKATFSKFEVIHFNIFQISVSKSKNVECPMNSKYASFTQVVTLIFQTAKIELKKWKFFMFDIHFCPKVYCYYSCSNSFPDDIE